MGGGSSPTPDLFSYPSGVDLVMVKISYDDAETRLTLTEAYRDHVEQIIVITFFLGSFAILNLYHLVTTSSISTPFVTWLVIFVLIELYYVLPTARVRLDLEQNVWLYQKILFGIPIKQEMNKISDISKFIVYDYVNHKPSSSKWAIRQSKYVAAFQIWLFADDSGTQKKIVLFSHTTYGNDSHQRHLKLYSGLVESLRKIFESVHLPLEFDFIQDIFPKV
ncbi:MAG: hypothetical protein ACTSWW_01500 [Promethearchaeota archaeon]